MPLFISDEELRLLDGDAAVVAERADAAIRELRRQVDTVRAESDAAAIAAEQTAALLEQRFSDVAAERDSLLSANAALSSEIERHVADLAAAAAEKNRLQLSIIGKDGEMELVLAENSELQKAKRQALELIEHRDTEIREKNATIQCYLDKITNLADGISSKDSRMHEIELELTRCREMCTRLSQEKELLEKHNIWLDEQLNSKVKSLADLRRSNMDEEAKMAARISDLESELSESTRLSKRSKERSVELEQRTLYLEKELSNAKDAAAGSEQRLKTELSTVSKLAELYKERSEEWSRKAGELEGVIKALETHLGQVEAEYRESFEKEALVRKELEEEISYLKKSLEKCKAEMESSRKSKEVSLLPEPVFPEDTVFFNGSNLKQLLLPGTGENIDADNDKMIVPKLPSGVSGTALAASLLRDGWSLAKMYEKYQEAADALRHERWGRRNAENVLEKVLHEIEEKAELILDERAEHERMVEQYSMMNQKLQRALLEHENYESTILNIKAELRRSERCYDFAQKEIEDLQTQVSVLLKECQDIQLRCGFASVTVGTSLSSSVTNADMKASSEYAAFKDIHELVSQNVQLRNQVLVLSSDLERKEAELREALQVEIQKVISEATAKTEAVRKRSEEQAEMLESLHNSVTMYRRLYEEERKLHVSSVTSSQDFTGTRNDHLLPVEGPPDVTKKAYDKLVERAKTLEQELSLLRDEIQSLRMERDKLALEASFATERLTTAIADLDRQREEANAVSARNVEFSHLLVVYEKRIREEKDSLQSCEDSKQKLSVELSILKNEKEILLKSEKRALEEVHMLNERVHRLQTSLDTIQRTEEVRENARALERRRQEEHIVRLEKDWAEVKKELQDEHDRVRVLTLEKEKAVEASIASAMEKMKEELADAWRAVASAESRAAVAEAKCSDLEGKTSRNKVFRSGDSANFTTESNEELLKLKEEMEILSEEANANKNYMLQYKEIAHTNEMALKNIEALYEAYKEESEACKKTLQDEVSILQTKLSELEKKFVEKSHEFSAALELKENEAASAASDIAAFRNDITQKMSQIVELDLTVSNLKAKIDDEQKHYQIMKENYDRQVVMQSETIQELASTSKQLSSLQSELAKLQGMSNTLRAENNNLRSSLEHERSDMQKQLDESVRKYNELNEQNKILHSQLEVLHVRLADKEYSTAGSTYKNTDSKTENDLHSVISYLRRSKEIAETEISLLKQEKLRLQCELEVAVKASEEARSLLRASAENARATMLREEEFKSLQLQIRDNNLLRESNIHLSGENKHNFEESQKYRAEAEKAKQEVERLNNVLFEKDFCIEVCKKDIENKQLEIDNLTKKISEMSREAINRIDRKEHEQLKDEFYKMKVLITEKDVELGQTKGVILEKEEFILKLEETLKRCQVDLAERETKLNDAQSTERTLRSEIEKQKRSAVLMKKRMESTLKEKEELNKEVSLLKTSSEVTVREKSELAKENQDLSKQLESLGRKLSIETSTEHTTSEKDARLQTLEKTFAKERHERKLEKEKRVHAQEQFLLVTENVQKEKKKLEDEIANLKQAIAALETRINAAQLPSQGALDEQALAYFSSVDKFEEVATEIIKENEKSLTSEAPSSELSATDQSAAPSRPPAAQSVGSTDKKIDTAKKPGRRPPLVRPHLEEPQANREGQRREEAVVGTSRELPSSSSVVPVSKPLGRKRLVSSLQARADTAAEDAADVPSLPKKIKEDPDQESEPKAAAAISESTVAPAVQSDEQMEVQPSTEEMEADQVPPAVPNEETAITLRDDDLSRGELEEPMDVPADPNLGGEAPEELPERMLQPLCPLDEGQKGEDVKDRGNDEEHEEGELMADEPEQMLEDSPLAERPREPTPTDGADDVAEELADVTEAASPEPTADRSDVELTEDAAEGFASSDQGGEEGDTGSQITSVGPEGSPSRGTPASAASDVATGSGTASPPEAEESRGRTISIADSAKSNALMRRLRQQQAPSSPAPTPARVPRGRGRASTTSYRPRDTARGRGRTPPRGS